ncbi:MULTISPECIES: DUF2884 family protein [unclassified Luteimonas]
MKHVATLAMLVCLPLLAACQRDADPPPPASDAQTDADARPAPQTALGRTVAKAMDEARRELHEGNLSLNGDYDVQINGKRIRREAGDLPAAELTPDGQLIVAGTTVAMDDASRALARKYRAGLLAIAEAGMDLGVQGADLGMRAAADAIGSLFRGDTEQMEKRVEAEAEKLKATAMQLCEQLPALLAAQQALATAVPEFAPYARVETGDIEDCNEEAKSGRGISVFADDPAAEADAAADSTH